MSQVYQRYGSRTINSGRVLHKNEFYEKFPRDPVLPSHRQTGHCENISPLYIHRASRMVPAVENPPVDTGDAGTWIRFLGWEDRLEESMVTHSSIPAWESPQTQEPRRP